jgi:hypothetical protein
MRETGVYLYTHWRGDELLGIVKKAIARKQRWNDVEYLTRIIFCEMINPIKRPIDVGTAMVVQALTDETGFGIGNQQHGDLNVPLIIVDTENQTVVVAAGKVIPFGKC